MRDDVDIQSWPQVPSIAHFCSLFREAFGLLEFDMEQLEEGLLLLGSEEEGGLITKLIIKLLVGCIPMYKKYIKEENYSKYLKQFFQTKLEEAEEDRMENVLDNPFQENGDKDFVKLPLKDKVRVLHQLCEYRLEAPDVADRVKNLEAASLRVEPLGVDSEGTTLWYFYGTRLYKETASKEHKDKSEKKKKKKHKKEKKKKRKKSKDTDTDSSEEGENSEWSVACLTEHDWKALTEKYKDSKRKEDRRLYRLLKDSFLPEILEMFKEKERERRKKEASIRNPKRASSRIETLKKHQEEKDRQLAIMLAQEYAVTEKKGRRKRGGDLHINHPNSSGLQDGGAEASETGEDGGSGSVEDELAREREERAKQRQMMKEMRAKKEAEKLVESKFKEEVSSQRARLKELEAKRRLGIPVNDVDSRVGNKKSGKKRKQSTGKSSDDVTADKDGQAAPPPSSKRGRKGPGRPPKSPRYSSPDDLSPLSSPSEPPSPVDCSDEDDMYRPPPSLKTFGKSRHVRAGSSGTSSDQDSKSGGARPSAFSNALIKAGSRSTKDSSLEKPGSGGANRASNNSGASSLGGASLAAVAADAKLPPVIQRKGPGLLLQAAGRGLLNLQPKERDEFSELLKPKKPTISFGLYGGHLSVDQMTTAGGSGGGNGRLTNDLSSAASTSNSLDDKPFMSLMSNKDKPQESTKKVFSNWGGDFFKKNLDFRANTNKIMEKMQLTKGQEAAGNADHSSLNSTHHLVHHADHRLTTSFL